MPRHLHGVFECFDSVFGKFLFHCLSSGHVARVLRTSGGKADATWSLVGRGGVKAADQAMSTGRLSIVRISDVRPLPTWCLEITCSSFSAGRIDVKP